MKNVMIIKTIISGMDACKYFNFSGTVPPVTENMPSNVIKPTISKMKVKAWVGLIILPYNSSLSLHFIKFSQNSIPQAGMINQFKTGKQLTIFWPWVSIMLPNN